MNPSESFQPLESKLKARISLDDGTHIQSISPTSENPTWPKVNLVTKEEKVVCIQVECECGKQMNLVCE